MDDVILISSDSSNANSPVSVRGSYKLDNSVPSSQMGSSTALPPSPKPSWQQFTDKSLQSCTDLDDDADRPMHDWPPVQNNNGSGNPKQAFSELNPPSSSESSYLEMPTTLVRQGLQNQKLEGVKRAAHTLSDESDEEPLPTWYSSQARNRFAHTLSDNSEDEEVRPWLKQSQNVGSLSDDANENKKVSSRNFGHKTKRTSTSNPKKYTKGSTEERCNAASAEQDRKKQRLQKLAAQAESKAAKQALAQAQKMYKPEECIKYLTAELDTCLFEEEFGGDLTTSLQEVGISYAVQAQIIPMSISWTRKLPDGDKFKIHDEKHSMVVLPCERITQHIQSRDLCGVIQNMQAIVPDKKISIVLHGTEKYLRSQKKGKSTKSDRVSREDFMEALVEVQLFTGCSHRFVDSALELATLVSQFTKAVAEIPHRIAKARKENDKLDWFGENDNRDCARVDKNGLGLQRLWQQQLCEFNMAGLQMAEAITAVYHSPQALFKAYDRCSSQSEGEKLLQDIPIRRDLETLSSVRRIGPELSKKLYTFFNAVEGHLELSHE